MSETNFDKNYRGSLCVANGCQNRQDGIVRKEAITFHAFPLSQPDRTKKWEKMIGKENFHAKKWSRICSLHFKQECFNRTGKRVRLHEDAVPTEFHLPVQKRVVEYQAPMKQSCISSVSSPPAGGTYCCVPKCGHSGGYKFPLDKTLRSRWICAIRRDHFHPTPYSVVCHRHFKLDDFRQDMNYLGVLRKQKRLIPGSVPSIFDWAKPTSDDVLLRKESAEQETASATMEHEVIDVTENVIDEFGVIEEIVTSSCSNSHSSLPSSTTATETQTYLTDVANTSTQTVNAPALSWAVMDGIHLNYENLQHDAKILHYYTGLETGPKLLTVFQTLGPAVNHLVYYKATVVTLPLIDQFILMLAKLRQDLDYLPLSRMFGVSTFTAHNVFITWVNFCARQWGEIDLWPNRELVSLFAPNDFRNKFPFKK